MDVEVNMKGVARIRPEAGIKVKVDMEVGLTTEAVASMGVGANISTMLNTRTRADQERVHSERKSAEYTRNWGRVDRRAEADRRGSDSEGPRANNTPNSEEAATTPRADMTAGAGREGPD